jgi:hypothetical protein
MAGVVNSAQAAALPLLKEMRTKNMIVGILPDSPTE